MWASTACSALAKRKCLELSYDGFFRVVEVHAVGVTKDENEVMRVWQVRGGSNTGENQGWKLLRLDEAIAANITNEESHAPRPGYVRDDKAMKRIICQV